MLVRFRGEFSSTLHAAVLSGRTRRSDQSFKQTANVLNRQPSVLTSGQTAPHPV